MPTVDFLPFATGGGANVTSQAAYAADAVVGTGFQAGIAPSAKFNKALRQSSLLTAAIAHFMSTALTADVLDDGNLSTLTTQFTNAISAVTVGTAFSTRAQGKAGTDATTSVNPDVLAQTVQSGTLTFAVAGGSANALTATMVPVPAALVAGLQVVVQASATNTGAATINVNALGAKAIQLGGSALAAGAIQSGLVYTLIYDGTQFQLQGTPTTTLASLGGQAALTITANGLGIAIGFPISGVTYYLQAGVVTIPGNTDGTITYPVSLTTTSYCVVSGGAANNDDSTCRVRSTSTSGATAANSDNGSHSCWWISLGY